MIGLVVPVFHQLRAAVFEKLATPCQARSEFGVRSFKFRNFAYVSIVWHSIGPDDGRTDVNHLTWTAFPS